MSSTPRASKAAKPTINYQRFSLDEHHLFGAPDALITKERDANHQPRQSPQSCRAYADRRLTTPQFVSALAGIWNLVGHTESSGAAQRSEIQGVSSREDPVCFSSDQQGHVLTPCYEESSSGLRPQNCQSTPKSIYEDLISVRNMLMLKPSNGVFGASSTWRHIPSINKVVSAPYLQCGNIYSLQTEKTEQIRTSLSSKRSMCEENYVASTNMDTMDDSYSNQTRSIPAELCTISNEEASSTHDCGSSLYNTKSDQENLQHDSNLLSCSVHEIEIAKEVTIMQENQVFSKACTDVQLDKLEHVSSLVGDAVVRNSANADEYAYGSDMFLQHSVDKCLQKHQPTFLHRFDGAVTINKHAVAGALAGTAVSVSLHPVDTVKTIIQANSCGQSCSFYHTLRCILVERGVLGLYGGLASKLVCSAPISAIYTLTYETVKGALLPVVPKDYHSIVHCAAGGCSSIATSFVFTPSECIKQQMQVGSRYQNCWNALMGCLKKGGIASLYAGWGAVLYRNILHSVVKFYAYESLKQSLLKSVPDSAKLNSGQTLLCGGFAGSTAAFCTTPFDVVKTRVQLQALNPVIKYNGALHALKEIFRQEGLHGLYRGLTPRLVMYVSQGAIFFTSYEFLKSLMFPEPEQQVPASSF